MSVETEDPEFVAIRLKLVEDARGLITDVMREQFGILMTEFFNNYHDVTCMPRSALMNMIISELQSRGEFTSIMKNMAVEAVKMKLNGQYW